MAVLGVKPWEYEPLCTATERQTQTRRTVALSQFAARSKICSNCSAFYLFKLTAPRYAIFLRNAVAEQTMADKLMSPVIAQ